MRHPSAPGLVATYRIQLRNGVDLEAVRARIPWLQALGISHIYLSPLFSAAKGSTHGYDVTDPNRVDPVLGGDEAFRALSDAARAAGLGIVLDIVPNHMAFTPENPFIADIMRHGQESRFAPLFDIDWDRGPLQFPVLDGTPADLLDAAQLAFSLIGNDPTLRVYDKHYPLRATPLTERLAGGEGLNEGLLAQLLDEQHWQIGHWQDDGGDIVHRRFFNVTDLIGVRQEDPEVFEFTHRWIVEQVRAGRVQGVRVDHIDGLARPLSYLRRLREALGFIPIWVEKIVKEGEPLAPGWPVEGMSGYEFMAPVTQLLTPPEGLDALAAAARGHVPTDYALEVRGVRRTMLYTVFTPELDRVTDAAIMALAGSPVAAPEVRAAIVQLAMHWPVYRSYAADVMPPGDLCAQALAGARGDPHPSGMLGPVFSLLSAPDDPLARAFAARFEQLTGALTAKSEEDTVFYRSIAYLPYCEVGAAPDLQPIDLERFAARMNERASETPCALNALSTHDTKRSADARAAIIALAAFPELGAPLYGEALARAQDRALPPRWGIYAIQCALMMLDQPDAAQRIADHIAKAMREAKLESSYEEPALEMENGVTELALSLMASLEDGALWSDDERQAFLQTWEALMLAQTALQITAPGVPDIYQGTEIVAIALTDPDNRQAVDWDAIASGPAGRDARKLKLTQDLLARRREDAELFAMGSYRLERTPEGLRVTRTWQNRAVTIDIPLPDLIAGPDAAARGAHDRPHETQGTQYGR
ncbi:(1-_4)-alpha-D-glucan 1-alpha-D-glucosylmutase [Sphingobium sp. B2D3A]|uniref:malto-oligosyltrehalose synthase n=1 Tax=unclassified Sphingobium TaxID=2611147 RepID=UPI002224FD61|nr:MULTISPECIES: malto-oligosyltrehalose synthase [unclassified Sphingobium]MCW2335998.1 (1->4)-alpha-D-glucan 1-alpha-D-glucosylmutase [Sphingobium sp. B2D3A]MCW2385757.1 (1->4)-alpha-D-glucan 1-alpha-D-glucosylmutase [Sphingobium sp. B2D3D]